MASGSCQKICKLTVHQLLANCPLPNSQVTDVQQLFDSPIFGEICWKLILANYLYLVKWSSLLYKANSWLCSYVL